MRRRSEAVDLYKNYTFRKRFVENAEHRANLIKAKMAGGYSEELARRELSDLECQKNMANAYICLADAGLNVLDEHERQMIEHFYINRPGNYMDLICEELSCEERQVYKYKERALDKICASIYGVCEQS